MAAPAQGHRSVFQLPRAVQAERDAQVHANPPPAWRNPQNFDLGFWLRIERRKTCENAEHWLGQGARGTAWKGSMGKRGREAGSEQGLARAAGGQREATGAPKCGKIWARSFRYSFFYKFGSDGFQSLRARRLDCTPSRLIGRLQASKLAGKASFTNRAA